MVFMNVLMCVHLLFLAMTKSSKNPFFIALMFLIQWIKKKEKKMVKTDK